ncbi:MAG: rhodanese-related sulfurtransferase [Candidatus Sericytochromatia bacterium]|nr:rhodanese-related sulfurtransferase [Candidatus Sericytochromatia bacterium]
MSPYQIATFYRFVSLPDAPFLQSHWLELAQQHHLKGTLLIAHEGLNATLAGTPSELQAFLDFLCADPRLGDMPIKFSQAEQQPFARLRVRLRKEIVNLGLPVDPTRQVGTYVPPEEWNQLIASPDVLLIDTRNDYEYAIGTFEGAVDPGTEAFSDFPDYVSQHLDPARHKRVAMFCTGGIRCEKATAWMLSQGFEAVYHLEGGILNYLEKIPPQQSRWRGECFVFDERVSVNHALQPGTATLCEACGAPVLAAEKKQPGYEAGVACPRCVDQQTAEQKQARRERFQPA